MSDTTSLELGKIGGLDEAPGTSVSDVLLEQVDAKVSAIEERRNSLKPYQAAVVVTTSDLEKLKAALAASTNSDIKHVYERAISVAIELENAVKKQGQEVVDEISDLQVELEKLLEQLKKEDPNNLLISQI